MERRLRWCNVSRPATLISAAKHGNTSHQKPRPLFKVTPVIWPPSSPLHVPFHSYLHITCVWFILLNRSNWVDFGLNWTGFQVYWRLIPRRDGPLVRCWTVIGWKRKNLNTVPRRCWLRVFYPIAPFLEQLKWESHKHLMPFTWLPEKDSAYRCAPILFIYSTATAITTTVIEIFRRSVMLV